MISPPRHLPRNVEEAWLRLDSPTVSQGAVGRPPGGTLTGGSWEEPLENRLRDVPAPVSRWIERAVEEPVPLHSGARIAMHGEIRVGGRWRPFSARQVLSPDGFVWAATAGRFPMRISGFDRCSDGSGEMRWKLAGLVPVMSAEDSDTHRSAAGRLAGELMLIPGAAIGTNVTWSSSTDGDRHCTAAVTAGGFTHDVTVGIGAWGTLESVTLLRWGDPDGEAHREHVFGVELEGNQRMGAYRVPRTMRAGWFFETPRWTDGEFFRATIDQMEWF